MDKIWYISYVTVESAQTGLILFLTRYWIVFQWQENKTLCHAVKACTEERILTFNNTLNQSFPHPSWNQNAGTWPELDHQNPFRGESSAIQEEKVLDYYSRSSAEALQLKSAPRVLPYTWLSFSNSLSSTPNPQSGRHIWALPPVSLPVDLNSKPFIFLKSQCHSISFYARWAGSPCSVTYTMEFYLTKNK